MTQATRLAVMGAGTIGRTHIDCMQGQPQLALADMVDPTPAVSGQAVACTLAS